MHAIPRQRTTNQTNGTNCGRTCVQRDIPDVHGSTPQQKFNMKPIKDPVYSPMRVSVKPQ